MNGTMQRTGRRTGRAAMALLLCAVAAGVGQAQDKIILKDGKERTGVKILSEDYDRVRFQVGQAASTLKWTEVDSIRYSNAPKYDKAIETVVGGKAAEAVPLLEAVLAEDKLRPPLRHGALYHLGLAQQKLGKTDEAVATYEKLLTEFPTSRYLFTVSTNLLAMLSAKGDLDRASKILDTTLANARTSESDSSLQAGFDLLRAKVFELQKKLPDAERTYERAANATDAPPELVASAKLGLARCAQQAGRTSDAEKKYRDIVGLDAPNEVLAGAWNGIGDIALAAATSKRDPEGLRLAMFAYLRGVVLYVPGRGGGPTEEHERALAGASKAFKAIGELETDAELKRLFLDRAKKQRDQLVATYPTSRFLQGL